jgi:ribonuclease HI
MENVPVSRCHKKWSRPAIDEYKINTDGAFLATRGGGGWGYVIRNHDGQVVKAGAGKSTHLLDAFHSEVLACKAGVQATEEYWGCLAL